MQEMWLYCMCMQTSYIFHTKKEQSIRMKHKDVIEVYQNIIKQTQNHIGKKVNIRYPNRTGVIAVKDYEVTLDRLNRLIDRKNKLMGGVGW